MISSCSASQSMRVRIDGNGKPCAAMLALVPAGADAELDAPARDPVSGDGVAREHRGMAERGRRDQRPEPQLGRDRGQRAERSPGVERSASADAVDRPVVIRAEQRLEAEPLARLGERDPVLPGHVLLALDHHGEAHGPAR